MRRVFHFLFFIFIAAQHLCMRGVWRVGGATVNIERIQSISEFYQPRLILQVAYTGWRQCIECLIIAGLFSQKNHTEKALLREITYKDKAYDGSLSPCSFEPHV